MVAESGADCQGHGLGLILLSVPLGKMSREPVHQRRGRPRRIGALKPVTGPFNDDEIGDHALAAQCRMHESAVVDVDQRIRVSVDQQSGRVVRGHVQNGRYR